MSTLKLINESCAEQKVDAIVNAANKYLAAGGGICGVIFNKAGVRELTEACNKCNLPLRDGEAVITPSFNIENCNYIIHAVGPNFGSTPKAFAELYEAYYNSLLLLKKNELHSISFPLISAGIFGGTLADAPGESTKQCVRAYNKFVSCFPDYDIEVILCAYGMEEFISSKKVFENSKIQ
ncbi:O-acetyl-ADP-ribose deacetylase (regulator of RNase III), contains Macro domain [Pseudobutyrivibrio sp. YE44]|uniref:macro domain-containing protein n=1 Tax=Pseudobutyrivibrio sp. YE44 TaxID=1520802 RepID=UPI00088869EF|nr:macro domain-containing protein [Pseudobutyrivibrio sp. YE44]SDB55506.1 O-acetyl-ADP-ribose deacetylase (regulator of RNase III), contains Macro domain [Pseudobutyrivibrio sp. YE44]